MNNSESEEVAPKYRKLRNPALDDSGYFDAQFERPKRRIPWKAIAFATFLFMMGTMVIFYSMFKLLEDFKDDAASRWIALFVLGLIMFIPGSYHVAIAYLSYKQYPGYSFDDILDFD